MAKRKSSIEQKIEMFLTNDELGRENLRLKARIRELEAELADVRLDSTRLDFAEKHRLDIRSNAMTGKVDVSTAELHPCHRRRFSHKSMRGAIDKAMAAEAERAGGAEESTGG